MTNIPTSHRYWIQPISEGKWTIVSKSLSHMVDAQMMGNVEMERLYWCSDVPPADTSFHFCSKHRLPCTTNNPPLPEIARSHFSTTRHPPYSDFKMSSPTMGETSALSASSYHLLLLPFSFLALSVVCDQVWTCCSHAVQATYCMPRGVFTTPIKSKSIVKERSNEHINYTTRHPSSKDGIVEKSDFLTFSTPRSLTGKVGWYSQIRTEDSLVHSEVSWLLDQIPHLKSGGCCQY